jgi:hypothetical protein
MLSVSLNRRATSAALLQDRKASNRTAQLCRIARRFSTSATRRFSRKTANRSDSEAEKHAEEQKRAGRLLSCWNSDPHRSQVAVFTFSALRLHCFEQYFLMPSSLRRTRNSTPHCSHVLVLTRASSRVARSINSA